VKKDNKENEQEEKKVNRSKSKDPKKKAKKDDTESEEEHKTNASAVPEKIFMTWKKPDQKGGKKTFVDDFVKKARD